MTDSKNGASKEKKTMVCIPYNFIPSLKDEVYIDCKDTLGSWCVAQITNTQKDKIRIHYIGWSLKYDEDLSKNSNKIGPFRRFSYGYTGQQSSSLYFKEP